MPARTSGFDLIVSIGRALAPVREEGVLIVGRGLSWHNLRGIFSDDAGAIGASDWFDRWLTGIIEVDDPLAAHSDEDHLSPLMVAAGVGKDDRGCRM